ncbi:S41 family peptidase [Caenispirillum bisanense]|uniref:S41 family peptidase n=1 Tax=Caenispirillum bisanense TaxID=414052 RepID=UPI0031E24E4A
MTRRPLRRRIAALPLALAALAAATTAVAADDALDATAAARLVRERHIDRLQPPPEVTTAGTTAALIGWLRSVDPYARLTPPRPAGDDAPLRLGVQVLDDRGDGPPLLLPLPGGVVEWAGQRRPFRLLSVDGHPTRGAEGTAALAAAAADGRPLVLELRDADAADADAPAHRIAVTPRVHQEPALQQDQVGPWQVIRLYRFTDGITRRALAEALAEAGERPVLLDLRWATGGHLLEAIDAASLFMPQRVAVTTTVRSAGGADPLTYTSRDDWWRTRGPVVVLVGPHTASSAEVLVRALDHWGWAIVAGRPTYGKCVFQEEFALPSGATLGLTVGRLLDPAGQWCGGHGVMPQILLTAPQDDLAASLSDLEAALADRAFVCREALFDDAGAAAERVRLGWQDGVGRLQPVLMKRGPRLRLCLAPLLPTAAAAAVARDQAAATGSAMAVDGWDGTRREIVMPPATATVALPSAPAPSPPLAQAEGDGGPWYGVRLGSYRNPANAATEMEAARTRHAGALGELRVVSRQVDLADSGTWVRVYVVRFATADAAAAFCEEMGLDHCRAQRVCTVPRRGETSPGAC